jgi:DNA polymerase delta subunit 4
MPATRRTSRKAAASPAALQSKLSFHGTSNKVTKNTSPQSKETKAALKKDPALLDSLLTQESTPAAEILPEEAEKDLPETTAQKAITEQALSTASTLPSRPYPSTTTDATDSQPTTTESVLGGRAAPNDPLGATNGFSGWLGDEEQRARKISESQIKKYWRAKEAQRLAPRVHQDDLGVREKVLREWDMSGEFGVSFLVCSGYISWSLGME